MLLSILFEKLNQLSRPALMHLQRIHSYRKLLRTSYELALKPSMPLKHFEAHKTGSEKDLILTRVERGGLPCYFITSLADMAHFGGTDAQ